MYQSVLYLHSILRYFVLILLIIVIVKSLMGWLNAGKYSNADNKLSLFLLIFTHTQLLVGLLLYFVSPFVQFNHSTMKDAITRYWSVEHVFMMLIAVALITVGRISHKKKATDLSKFKTLFYFNFIALLIILIAIVMSGRGMV